MILVGTSGFRYRDWVPVFYPRNLNPNLWLRHYSRYFGCCELALTCYRIPETSMVQQLAEESGGALQFVFRVPFQLLTDRPENAELVRRFTASLWPLQEAGQLAGVLAQFSEEFSFIRANFERLCLLRDSLEKIPLIAEFACADWLTSRAAKNLTAARVALACGDGGTTLSEKAFFQVTAEPAYVRFQGRNQSKWIKGDGSTQHDYLYSRAELEAVAPEIRRLEEESERVLVFMNNPWRGQAAINARMLLEILANRETSCRSQG